MHGILLRLTGKPVVAILCVLSLLTMSLGAVSRAADADSWDSWPRKLTEPGMEQNPAADATKAVNDWETWPRKKAEPSIEPTPATDARVAVEAGDDANKRKPSRRSYRTLAWIVLGIAAIVGIGIAASGGGDDGGTVTNPGHQ